MDQVSGERPWMADTFEHWVESAAGSDHALAWLDESVPLDRRRDAVRSTRSLFTELFAKRCSQHLSHLDQAGVNPLNAVCYMWWDIGAWRRPSSQGLDDECLSLMRETLAIDSIACQESALHGLGHWHHGHPARVEAIVDGFLTSQSGLSAELRQYALAARAGRVQ